MIRVVPRALVGGGALAALALGAVLGLGVTQTASPAEAAGEEPAPKPEYAVNQSGQTFGSAMGATSPADEPDLIRAVTPQGISGYVRKADLYGVQPEFKSPAAAIAWQEAHWNQNFTVPIYASDGKTKVGEFVIEGPGDDRLH